MPWGFDDEDWVRENIDYNRRFREPEGELLDAQELLSAIWPDYNTFKERQAFERARTSGRW